MKHNNLTTSVTLLDKLHVSDLFLADKEPGLQEMANLETVLHLLFTFIIPPRHSKQRVRCVIFSSSNYASSLLLMNLKPFCWRKLAVQTQRYWHTSMV